jgi:MerR family transcriptional regulator/heat shock protein HspR
MADDPFYSRPLFMISIAAELAAMHPQTLRMYERRGLLRPGRSAKNTRLYSQEDVQRLRRIQELTVIGLNLAGVERVLELEEQMKTMAAEVERLHSELMAAAQQLRAEVDRVERANRHDLVRQGGMAVVPVRRRR